MSSAASSRPWRMRWHEARRAGTCDRRQRQRNGGAQEQGWPPGGHDRPGRGPPAREASLPILDPVCGLLHAGTHALLNPGGVS